MVGTRTLGWTVSSITLKLRVEPGAGVGVDRHTDKAEHEHREESMLPTQVVLTTAAGHRRSGAMI